MIDVVKSFQDEEPKDPEIDVADANSALENSTPEITIQPSDSIGTNKHGQEIYEGNFTRYRSTIHLVRL